MPRSDGCCCAKDSRDTVQSKEDEELRKIKVMCLCVYKETQLGVNKRNYI